MGVTQNLEWFRHSDGLRMGSIKFNTATATARTSLIANDTGMYIVGDQEQPLMLVANVVNAVNYVQLVPSVAGSPVQFLPQGADANIDAWLRTKGTGLPMFGTHTGSGDVACNGSISIKDSAGNVRKLMTTA
jgi:hypothetical protein